MLHKHFKQQCWTQILNNKISNENLNGENNRKHQQFCSTSESRKYFHTFTPQSTEQCLILACTNKTAAKNYILQYHTNFTTCKISRPNEYTASPHYKVSSATTNETQANKASFQAAQFDNSKSWSYIKGEFLPEGNIASCRYLCSFPLGVSEYVRELLRDRE